MSSELDLESLLSPGPKPEPTHAEPIDFDPQADPNLLSKSLGVGGVSALLGGLGSLLTGGNPLSSAAKYGLGGAGTAAYALADPFQRGGMLGKAFESGAGGALQGLMTGGDASSGALQGAMTSLISGKGRFTPEEQKSLAQQFVQSVIPSVRGWRKRITDAERASRQLMGRNPASAMPMLKKLIKVLPDVQSKASISHAMKMISSGNIVTPNERNALGSIGRFLLGHLNIHKQLTPQLDTLAKLKQMFAAGKLSTEDIAKRMGLVAGRFGSSREEVQRMRNFMQQVFARPVQGKGELAGLFSQDPEVAAMMSKAMSGVS